MSNASNATTLIGIIPELTFGNTPVSPQLTAQRFAEANFTNAKQELLDESKTASRQYSYTKVGNTSITGSISSPFAHNNFDTLLESLFYNSWNNNQLILGNTVKSFTLEEAQADASVFRSFRGCIVNSFTLSSPVEGLTTASFSINGLNETVATSSIDISGVYTPQAVREPFLSCGGTISEGGSPIAYVTNLELTVNNNISPVYAWGECSTSDLIPGKVDVTFSLTCFIPNATLYNKFLNNTGSSLEFTLSDGSNNITFLLPNIKYTSADLPVASGSGLRAIQLAGRALFDSGINSTIRITRSA
jgi:hypothetical protein